MFYNNRHLFKLLYFWSQIFCDKEYARGFSKREMAISKVVKNLDNYGEYISHMKYGKETMVS